MAGGDPRRQTVPVVYGLLAGTGGPSPRGTNYPEPGTPGWEYGSDNWPWGATQAANDWDALAGWARHELQDGLRRRELGSELYDPDVVTYRVTGLKLAPADQEVRQLLAQGNRAQLSFYAITAVLGSRTSTRLITNDADDEGGGDVDHYRGGISVCPPGHRFNAAIVGQGTLGPIVAWALGYQPTVRWRYLPLNPEQNFWHLALLEAALGAKYGAPTPEEAWGLKPGDRQALRALIEQDSIGGLDHAIEALAPYRLYGPLEIEVRGTARGRNARLINAVNGEKPQLVCSYLDRSGRYIGAVPAAWSRKEADLGTSVDTGTVFRAMAGKDNPKIIDVPYVEGQELFRFQWGGAHTPARRAGGAVQAGPPPPPKLPVDPPATPQEGPAGGGKSDQRAAAMREVAATLRAWTPPAKADFAPQRELRARLLEELEGGHPARPLSAIAADVRTFGAWANHLADLLLAAPPEAAPGAARESSVRPFGL